MNQAADVFSCAERFPGRQRVGIQESMPVVGHTASPILRTGPSYSHRLPASHRDEAGAPENTRHLGDAGSHPALPRH